MKTLSEEEFLAKNIEFCVFSEFSGGVRFILCRDLTDDETAYLQEFDNVHFGTATYRYAPEIRHPTVILTNITKKGSKSET